MPADQLEGAIAAYLKATDGLLRAFADAVRPPAATDPRHPNAAEGETNRNGPDPGRSLREVPQPMVTVAEACAALRIGLSTLYGWIDGGKLPRDAVVRVGDGRRRGVRIKAWWVESYQRNGEMPKVRGIGGRRA